MNNSIKIIDKVLQWIFTTSKIRSNEPLYKNLDKLPADIREEIKTVSSDELTKQRFHEQPRTKT